MDDIERKLRELGERTAEQVRYGEVPRGRLVHRARLRRSVIVGGPAIAAVLLAAVVFPRLDLPGRDGGGDGRAAEFAAVASATEGAGTARIETEMSYEMAGNHRTMRGIGVVDFENLRSRFLIEQTDPTLRMEFISVGRSMFQRVLDEDGVGEAEWHETEMPRPGGTSVLGGDPASFLSYLRSVSEDVTHVGEETLDGVRVDHYRAEAHLPSDDRSLPDDARLEPLEVWVDDEDRLRRLTYGLTSDVAATLHVSMRLWDFGVPVEIEAPDPEDVTNEPLLSPGESGTQGTDGLPEFPEGSTTYVTGSRMFDGPTVVLNVDQEGFTLVCVAFLPRDTTRAAIVHEDSGRRVFTIAGVGGNDAVCDPKEMPHEHGDALRSDPAQFSLTLTKKDGSSEIVELTETLAPMTGE